MIRTWTPKHIRLLKKYYPVKSLPDVAKLLGKGESAVKSKATVLKIKKKKKFYRSTWTKKQDNFLKKNYLKYSAKEVASLMGKTGPAIKARLNVLGIKLPENIKEKRQEATFYKKGSVPFNKGLKQSDFMSKEAIKKSRKTTFKKGNLPYNTKHDMAISLRKDTKTGRMYYHIRESLGKWIPLHIHIYKLHHKKVPKNKIIVFKDNNTSNLNPENLMAITRQQHIDRLRNTDDFIASRLAVRNEELKKELLNHPEIIELARINNKLKKIIKNK
jgi:hypothetical protein